MIGGANTCRSIARRTEFTDARFTLNGGTRIKSDATNTIVNGMNPIRSGRSKKRNLLSDGETLIVSISRRLKKTMLERTRKGFDATCRITQSDTTRKTDSGFCLRRKRIQRLIQRFVANVGRTGYETTRRKHALITPLEALFDAQGSEGHMCQRVGSTSSLSGGNLRSVSPAISAEIVFQRIACTLIISSLCPVVENTLQITSANLAIPAICENEPNQSQKSLF